MHVNWKGKKEKIPCGESMPYYTRGEDGCGQAIQACKSCILKYLGARDNKGWDDEENISYDMSISIDNEHVASF